MLQEQNHDLNLAFGILSTLNSRNKKLITLQLKITDIRKVLNCDQGNNWNLAFKYTCNDTCPSICVKKFEWNSSPQKCQP